MIDLSALHSFTGMARNGIAIALRPMQAADEPAFRDLYAEMRSPELRQVPWSDADKRAFCDAQYTLQDRHYREHYGQFLPLAVCVSGAVVGRLYLGVFEGALILMDITIATAQRGNGIGTLLVDAVVALADAQRLEMRLHVEPDNPVRKLYQRLGFVAVGEAGVYQAMTRLPRSLGLQA